MTGALFTVFPKYTNVGVIVDFTLLGEQLTFGC